MQTTKNELKEAKSEITQEIQRKINWIIASKKVNLTTIAKGINKSPSTLSLYMNNTYTGDIASLEKDLIKYIQTSELIEKTEIKTLQFVETAIAKRIFNAANMCQMKGKMGACYGAPGIGKTTAIAQYQSQNAGVIIVDPFEQTSPKAVLLQIADQLKINYHQNMSLDTFVGNIVKKLAKNKYIIIVDEAENLKIDVFKVIRKIHDKTRENCGVLFVGTEELGVLLVTVKNGFPYISSRIGYVEKLDVLKLDDIEKLVAQYFPNCTKELLKTVATLAGFNARNIQNLLDLCSDIMESNDIDELNQDVIETAREKLLI